MGKLKERLAAGRPYFIAEMSANHGNDLDLALKIVDAAAASGADCLKVQTYTADTMTLDCDNEYFTIHGGLWDGMRYYDLYVDASFPWEWHEPVKKRCDELGIDFLSTPFDNTAVDFLIDLDVDCLKIASFELVDIPLIKYAASKMLPMIISTGMGSVQEIQEAVDAARSVGNNDIVLLRCCSEYPANPKDMNLSTIPDMAKRFGCHIGFSDHSMGHVADVVAASLGSLVIEKHFCLDRSIKTADSEFSMTPSEFKEMTEAVRTAIDSLGKPNYQLSETESKSLAYRRSIFASANINVGEKFTHNNIRVVRPSNGAKPKYYEQLLGTESDRFYQFGDPIIFGE